MTTNATPLDFLIDEAVRVSRAPLPDEIAELASQAIADAIVCAIGGVGEPEATATRRAFPATGDAALWGAGESRDPLTAALINGVTAHVLDYDDWAPGSGAHPSVAIVPALLVAAAGQEVRGERLLAAYVSAYELQERVGLSISPSHYAIGFHTTGIVGALGAACAAALILGANRDELHAAVALAATSASGLKSVFGSAGKPLNAGNAASVGLRAALLVMAGLHGPKADTVFGPQGLAPTHSDGVNTASLTQSFGEPWHLPDLLFKFSPACFGTHGAIDAAETLRKTGVSPSEVRSVNITVPPITRAVCAIAQPRTGLEAKFSLAFTAAAALEGAVTTASFVDPYAPSPTVQRLIDETTLTFDDSFAKTQATVSLTFIDGTVKSADADAGVPQWRAHPREQRDALRAKAHDLCDPLVGAAAVDRLWDVASGLASAESAHELLEAIQDARPSTTRRVAQ